MQVLASPGAEARLAQPAWQQRGPAPAEGTLVEAQSSPACYLREASQVKA